MFIFVLILPSGSSAESLAAFTSAVDGSVLVSLAGCSPIAQDGVFDEWWTLISSLLCTLNATEHAGSTNELNNAQASFSSRTLQSICMHLCVTLVRCTVIIDIVGNASL